MKKSIKLAAAALVAAGGLALMSTSASAAIVCNANGTCWHVRHSYVYRPEFGLVVHPDTWRWGPGEHYVWREHRGRGYWRDGVWITF